MEQQAATSDARSEFEDRVARLQALFDKSVRRTPPAARRFR
jgi:hypothetical protein